MLAASERFRRRLSADWSSSSGRATGSLSDVDGERPAHRAFPVVVVVMATRRTTSGLRRVLVGGGPEGGGRGKGSSFACKALVNIHLFLHSFGTLHRGSFFVGFLLVKSATQTRTPTSGGTSRNLENSCSMSHMRHHYHVIQYSETSP